MPNSSNTKRTRKQNEAKQTKPTLRRQEETRTTATRKQPRKQKKRNRLKTTMRKQRETEQTTEQHRQRKQNKITQKPSQQQEKPKEK